MKKKLPFFVAMIIATLFIFNNSLQNAEASSSESGMIVNWILYLAAKIGKYPSDYLVTLVVRKTAHITEFMLQGILLANCFSMPYKRRIIYILFFGLLTACVDEYIQFFSPGRGSMVQDVFVDFIGTIIATITVGISYQFRRK